MKTFWFKIVYNDKAVLYTGNHSFTSPEEVESYARGVIACLKDGAVLIAHPVHSGEGIVLNPESDIKKLLS